MKALPIKNEFGAGVLELARLASTEFLTASRRVSSKPVWVFQIVVDPTDATLVTQNYLRNGEMLTSEILIGLAALYTHATHLGHFPVYFNRGLYIEVGANTDGVMVQYLQDSP